MNSENRDDLIRTGWKRRFVIDRSRIEECVRLYGETGFDVKVLACEPDKADECSTCAGSHTDDLMVIYTRKSPEAAEHAGEGEV